jgi:hypothetical protein
MPLRSSFESLAWTSFLKTERECEERWDMDCAVAPGWVRRVSVDSTNSYYVLVTAGATVECDSDLPKACPAVVE